jgi:hypothetical protein
VNPRTVTSPGTLSAYMIAVYGSESSSVLGEIFGHNWSRS